VLKKLPIDLRRQVLVRQSLRDRLIDFLTLQNNLLPGEGHLAIELGHAFRDTAHGCRFLMPWRGLQILDDVGHLVVLVFELLDPLVLVAVLLRKVFHDRVLVDIKNILLELQSEIVDE